MALIRYEVVKDDWIRVDTILAGVVIFRKSEVSMTEVRAEFAYLPDKAFKVFTNVWGGRVYSINNHTDATPWTLHPSRADADCYLIEMYGEWFDGI